MQADLLVHGMPRFGRFKQPVTINWRDFEPKTPYGQPVGRLRKRLAFKQFVFLGFCSDDTQIGVALADLGWGHHAFFYIKQNNQPKAEEISLTLPAGLSRVGVGLYMQPLQAAHWRSPGLRVHLGAADGAARSVQVVMNGKTRLDARLLLTGVAPLRLCSPTGPTGWTYTQKRTTLPVEGHWMDAQGQRHGFDARWLGSSDDSCGFLRRETAWNWLNASGTLADGTVLGINLAQGVNDSFGTENALWINGQLFELPPVLFTPLPDKRWQMQSADGTVMLQACTGWCRRESLNLGVVGSHFRQWVGRVSGHVEVHGHRHVLIDIPALIEQHFARW